MRTKDSVGERGENNMSIQYCEKCDQYIDTDFNAEHFDEEVGGCEDTFEEDDNIPGFEGTISKLNDLTIRKI